MMKRGSKMLDKSIPYMGVLMIKEAPDNYPRYCLPDGYSFCMYESGRENDWAVLEAAVGEFNSTIEAVEYFRSTFMADEDELTKRCIFVKSQEGEIVATSTAWYGTLFDDEVMPRVHWVSVHPRHQGKGIAKALITKTLDIFSELGNKSPIYLTTQTWSYKAINIYLHFGFKPYHGPKPKYWAIQDNDFESESNKAWNLIYDIINNR